MRKKRAFLTLGGVLGGSLILIMVVNLVVSAATFDSKTALRFDGSNDMVLVADDGTLDFSGAFTVEAWVKPYSLGSGLSYKGILGGAALAESPTPGSWQLYLYDGDYSDWRFGVCTPSCVGISAGPGSLTVNTWTHLAGVFTEDSTVKIYQDGEFLGSVPHVGTVSPINFLKIGIWETAFNGWIDEVRIWNTARTENEIKAGLHRLLTRNDPGLVAYYRLDEGGGQRVRDHSTSGLDGILGYSSEGDLRDPYYETAYAPIASVLDQYFVETNYGFFLDDDTVRCQEFRPSVSPLKAIEVYVSITGDPGDLIVSIKDMSDQLLISAPSLVGTVPGSHWIWVNFDEVILLTPGQKYQLCVNTNQDYALSDRYIWSGHQSSTYHCSDCGTNLAGWDDFDFNFRTLSLPVEPVFLPLLTR